ncbi:MAG TPA: aminomethyl-transferring glycine dehydrogenase subunit GcvPB [Phycisphaerae bacterium]|nr:aminomethyl-transferring glycine dehydrogenase subunit GcvPB [Phycisphaerae bacterium]
MNRVGPNSGVQLIFEKSVSGACSVDLGPSDVPATNPKDVVPATMLAEQPPPLPEIAEQDLVRHYSRLGSRLFSVDANFYPLGSCTMKYNPRVNEWASTLPGFANLHPLQPVADMQGMLELLYNLRVFLAEIAGLDDVSLQPAAGAHGEMTGLMVINAYHADRGGPRPNVLTADTSHGTNPASCSICGRTPVPVKSRPDGLLDLADLREKVDDQTAALMITHPNTVGKFDDQIAEIADLLHKRGALLYMDGANLNAMLGITRPGDFGVDVMHFNTHKTFSTPHGCGGPGSGPIAVRKDLSPYLPIPQVEKAKNGTYYFNADKPKTIGKVRTFFGQTGVLVRCYAYIRALGPDGLRDVSEKAVLAANYMAVCFRKAAGYDLPYAEPYSHEFILKPKLANELRVLDYAKRLIDFGIHPPTMEWPIHGTLMIEPTETESMATLDEFVAALNQIAQEAAESPDVLKSAPQAAWIDRADEVAASRKPNLRWRPESNE